MPSVIEAPTGSRGLENPNPPRGQWLGPPTSVPARPGTGLLVFPAPTYGHTQTHSRLKAEPVPSMAAQGRLQLRAGCTWPWDQRTTHCWPTCLQTEPGCSSEQGFQQQEVTEDHSEDRRLAHLEPGSSQKALLWGLLLPRDHPLQNTRELTCRAGLGRKHTAGSSPPGCRKAGVRVALGSRAGAKDGHPSAHGLLPQSGEVEVEVESSWAFCHPLRAPAWPAGFNSAA